MDQSFESLKTSWASNQKKADDAARKEKLRQVRLAYKTGGSVPYSMRDLLELRVSLAVVRAVYRGV